MNKFKHKKIKSSSNRKVFSIYCVHALLPKKGKKNKQN